MPIYEYTCSNCEKLSDVLQKLNEPAPERCPACGAERTLSRVVSRTSFVLKGGGWGADLYASKKADAAPATAPESAKAPDKNAAPAAGSAPAASAPSTGSSSTSGTAAAPAAASPSSPKSDAGS